MLNQNQRDYLAELINIGVGQGAASLSEMVGAKIQLRVPDVDVCHLYALHKQLEKLKCQRVSAVRQGFTGSLSGDAYLIFSDESARSLAQKITEEVLDDSEGSLFQIEEVISEAGNIIINSFLGLWSHIFPNHLVYKVPVYHFVPPEELFKAQLAENVESASHIVVSANAYFHVKDIDVLGTILVVFEVSSIETLVGAIDRTNAPIA